MEESPKLFTKRTTRLSLSRRGRLDSPKSPGRITQSPEHFNTSPSIRPAADNQHSTPLNRHKRTCFAEESPSQDYDSSQLQITMSQDVRQNAVDVVWKWEESPKVKLITKPIPHKILDPLIGRPSRKAILRQSPECVQKKGFYKFSEELLQNMHNLNRSSSILEDITEHAELDSSLKENDFIPLPNDPVSTKDTKKNKMQHVERKNEIKLACKNHEPKETVRVSTKLQENKPEIPKSTIDELQTNFLDDSDLDNLLLQCSQKAEASYHNQIKRIKTENDLSFSRPDPTDELLLSLPLDGKFIESLPDNNKQPSAPECSSSSNVRSPLIRHNSMPTRPPIVKRAPQRPVISLMRHNSMPIKNKEQTERSSGLLSSSSESIVSQGDKRLCTSEEIKRKRLEAIQRREASKQKKASILVKNAINIRSN